MAAVLAVSSVSFAYADTSLSISDLIKQNASQNLQNQGQKSEGSQAAEEKFAQEYRGKALRVTRDIPEGEYVFISDPGKIGYINVFDYNQPFRNDTDGIDYHYSSYVENFDCVSLEDDEDDEYVDIVSGKLVPTDLVGKRDLSKNGTFRVGVDIPAGVYTFKLDKDCEVGKIVIDRHEANKVTSYYRLADGYEECAVRLENNTFLRKYGVDILNSQLQMYADYTPQTSVVNDTDKKYDFSKVRDGYKTKLCSDLTEEISVYSEGKNNANRYKESYVKNKIAAWKSSAQNDDEKKYADLLGDIYRRFYVFASEDDNADHILKKYVKGNKWIASARYHVEFPENMFEAERDEFKNIVTRFSNAKSFGDCELQRYNAFSMFYYAPAGKGITES